MKVKIVFTRPIQFYKLISYHLTQSPLTQYPNINIIIANLILQIKVNRTPRSMLRVWSHTCDFRKGVEVRKSFTIINMVIIN